MKSSMNSVGIALMNLFLVCSVSNAMHCQEKLVLKKKELPLDKVAPLQSCELEELQGKEVLWKKSDNSEVFYTVILGQKIPNMDNIDMYKIYFGENAGGVCNMDRLYKKKI